MKYVSVSVLCGLLLPGCPSASPPPEPAAAAPAKAEAPAALETVTVKAQVLTAKTALQGELLPFEAVALYARVQGFVDSIAVDRGSAVKQGQVLARLSAPELQAQRAEAEAKARAEQITHQRLRTASSTPGAVSKQELDQADAAWQASAARVTALRALEQYLIIKAPFDGVVTERNVHPGALVGPPQGASAPPLLRVEQLARLRLTVAVPEAYASAVAQGTAVEFTVRAWPRETFRAPVQRVAHSLDPKTRTMSVELDVDNQDGRLAPGMFAQVSWPLGRSGPSLLVPPSAVVRTTERTFVDRVRDDRPDGAPGVSIEQVPVQLGVTAGERVEIIGDLKAGDVILRRGREELATGSRVQTAPAETGK